MPNRSALIGDDEPDIRELLEITLGRMDMDTRAVATLGEADECLRQHTYDLCLTDMRLPDGDGLDLVRQLGRDYPSTPVAVITAYGNMDAAVTALKSGAFDFVAKPIELQDLRNLVGQALRIGPDEPAPQTPSANRLIGDSPAIRGLREQIAKIARSQAPVVITGESGSGKELVARLIHEQGPRANKPFVPINCGAIPGELMESEFFGHRRGAFTGANTDKDGLFTAAHGGTLFLDEIAELPLDMQVKLLRAVQEKRIRPVGDTAERPVDVRIVCASHSDLAAAVRAGRFREDLFYRLQVIALTVPPLRERPSDIPTLADSLIARLAADYAQSPPVLSEAARDALVNHAFPGNVRELENILERALALTEGPRIDADDLQLAQPAPVTAAEPAAEATAAETTAPGGDHDEAPASIDDRMDDNQRHLLTESLERHRWNRTAAARELGLTYRQLRYRLKKLGID
jgi:two-component system response regulator PilR (NtrC family)